jgi:hypothetical protein
MCVRVCGAGFYEHDKLGLGKVGNMPADAAFFGLLEDDLLGIGFLLIETFDGFVFVFSLGLMWWHGRSLRTSRSVMRIIPFRNSLVYAMI